MADLKRHPVPDDVDTTEWTLRVSGSVDQSLVLTRADLDSMSAESFEGEFACEEGWVADGLTWRGVRVGALLERAGPAAASQYGLVRAMDGGYACAFPVDRLAESILAFELDGEPLAPEHGGPARLVPTTDDRDCWESVKWVSEIELLEQAPTEADTAKELALSRLE